MNELLYRRYWERVREERTRLMMRPGVQSRWSFRSPDFSIGFDEITVPGTLPEKLLYRSLTERRVRFYFGYFFGDMPFTQNVEKYRPDFLLPDYNIIIDVTGAYWHSLPGSYQQDYQRLLWFAAAGYKIYLLPDYEILMNPDYALDSIPELRNPVLLFDDPVKRGYRPQDPTASLAAQRRKWPKVWVSNWRTRAGRTVGVTTRYRAIGARIRPLPPEIGPMLTMTDIDAELVAMYEKYGQDWLSWLNNLALYFTNDSNAKFRNPELWAYYNRWKDWWHRFRRA